MKEVPIGHPGDY